MTASLALGRMNKKWAVALRYRIHHLIGARKSLAGSRAVDVTIIAGSDVFDRGWYLAQYPDVAASGVDPVEHYVVFGAAEGRNPGPGFETAFYLENNPDVVACGINPLRHYIEFGQTECRLPAANQSKAVQVRAIYSARSSTVSAEADFVERCGIFDRQFYLSRYVDVASAGVDPVAHYASHGSKEGRRPCLMFDPGYYLDRNPAARKIEPLRHFCDEGADELRDPSAAFDMAWYWLTQLAQGADETNPLAHYLARGPKAADTIRAVGKLSAADKQLMATLAGKLLGAGGHGPVALTRLGVVFSRIEQWANAEEAFLQAAGLDSGSGRAHHRVAQALAKQGKWWQVADALVRAIEREDCHAHWFYELGIAQCKMNRFGLAAAAFERAIALDGSQAGWHYQCGWCHQKNGDAARAQVAYKKAVSLDPRADVRRFGVGVLHQTKGEWLESAIALEQVLGEFPLNADLHYKIGHAYDRCYQWAQARKEYEAAIALDPARAYWHYRLGFVLERLDDWKDAAESYAAAASMGSKHASYWRYRQGYVLELAGDYLRAGLAYMRTRATQTVDGREHPLGTESEVQESSSKLGDYLKKFHKSRVVESFIDANWHRADWHYMLGEEKEREQDWLGAAKAYANAVARSNQHQGHMYFRLGYTLYRAERFQEACAAFRETRILRRAFGVDMKKYEADAQKKMLMEYNEYHETLPVRARHILYESMHGSSIGGNPLAIFEYLVDRSEYADWTHLWVTEPDVPVPADLQRRKNVILIRRQSDLYRRYLATASHLVSDVTFPYWFIRRPEQKYLNTWHGTPLKKLGKDIPGEFMAHGNVQRNLLHATHLISPNRHTSDVLMNSYDVAGLTRAKLAETGYPRIDRALHATAERKLSTRQRLGLAGDRPVVLYAPTWRGEHGQAQFDVERLQTDMAQLAELPCQLVFRGHHMIEKMLRELDLPVAIAGPDIDTSDVLAITDVLVTDYSSIFFDFLPLRRPIIYYCYDLEEYAAARGLYFQPDDMPGTLCRTIEVLVQTIRLQLTDPVGDDDAYAKARHEFCPHDQGEAASAVVDFFLNDDDSKVVSRYEDSRTSLVFFAGHFPPNGITSSFLNLMNGLAEESRYQISVIIEPNRIRTEPSWMAKFRSLPSSVKVLAKFGRMVQSPGEYWVGDCFSARRGLSSHQKWDILQHAYRREYDRTFGSARIDALINFEGYAGLWTAIFGLGGEQVRKIAYLHNDMVEEFKVRHPYLKALFGIHRHYDRLVSVSPGMSAVNQAKMSREFGLDAAMFAPCINSINANEIRQRAGVPIDEDLQPWLEGTLSFVTMGRMSPEKDHAKLINAFKLVYAQNKAARLLILGDGPLRHALEEQIRCLGLETAVCLAGQRENPFSVLKQSSCFVLPSNHEGQPMVLLEALVLGKPIVATDIDGNRGVLEGGYGHLVPNNVEGLANGMRAFAAGNISFHAFDVDAYARNATAMFRKVVVNEADPNL